MIYIIIIIAIAFAYIFLKLQAPKIKGKAGEASVRYTINGLDLNYYYPINNLMFFNEGKTIQIDHLIVSNFGIFVIETKNYSGTIYGNENSKEFKQYLGSKINNFYSPIKQNAGHIYNLSQVLGGNLYISIIAFTHNAKLKVDSNIFVGYIDEIIDYIYSYRDMVIDNEEKERIIYKLSSINIIDKVITKKHVEDIYKRKEKYSEDLEKNICPRCGGNLILRKGKYGNFYGCSNYPKCKFKSNI